MHGEPLFLPVPLGNGIRSRFIDNVNGLRMHVLEAGFEAPRKPLVLLLHGFPELAYSWRAIMQPLADAGFHVVAPDQRGYGRTDGWDPSYDGDLGSFHILNIVRDTLSLVAALEHDEVACVVGHDFGSPVAAYCALIRPDVFHSVALMSAPFEGPPSLSENQGADIHGELAALARPRKHYQWYYGTSSADEDMRLCPQGITAFLRAYYHAKSADWSGNNPHPLEGWTAKELAKLPTYYIMDLDEGMAETVAPFLPAPDAVHACTWLPDSELAYYADEFARTGFQGGLQWYRCMTEADKLGELKLFAGCTIDVPACFIAGEQDWGIHQKPGALEAMQSTACANMISCDLVPGAGHWVQQEQPEAVVILLMRFLART